MNIIKKEDCIKYKKHNTRIFTSAFPFKHFCYYCMDEMDDLPDEELAKNIDEEGLKMEDMDYLKNKVMDLSNGELKELLAFIEKEIELSEICISEGNEKR